MATNLHTTHYRFGIDELAESTHGWHAAQDANPAQGVIQIDSTFLLRFTVQETGGTQALNTDQQFQCSLNGGTFQNITTSSTICKAVPAAAFVDAAHCTQRLSGTGSFESSGAGCTEDGLSGGNQNDIAASGNSETECGLQIVSTDVVGNDVITFRLTSPDFTITNDVVPTLIVALALATKSAAETLSVAGSDQASALALIIASDSLALPASEAGTLLGQPVPSDSCAVHLSETAPLVFIPNSLPLHLTDAAAITVVFSVTDTCALTTREDLVLAMQRAGETVTLALTEVIPLDPPVVELASDSLAVHAADGVPTIVASGASSSQAFLVTDTCAIVATEPASSNIALSIQDAVAVGSTVPGFGEDISIFAFTPVQFVSLSVVDTCAVQVPTIPFNLQAKAVADSCRVAMVEPGDSSLTWGLTEAVRLPTAEGLPTIVLTPPIVLLQVADTLVVESGDVVAVVVTVVHVLFSVTESAAIRSVDVISNLQVDFAVKAATDTLSLTVSEEVRPILASTPVFDDTFIEFIENEPDDLLVFWRLEDAAAVAVSGIVTDVEALGVADGAPALNILTHVVQAVTDTLALDTTDSSLITSDNFAFNVSDSLPVVAGTEVSTFSGAQAVGTTDAIAAHLTDDGPLVAAMLSLADALGLSVNDAAALLLKLLAVTDALGLPTTEAATLFSDFVVATATDSCAGQLAEAITTLQQVLTQLSASEGLVVSLDDQLAIANTQTINETVLLVTQDLATLLQSWAVADALRYRVDAEDANIINPLVINAFISLEDAAAIVLDDTIDDSQPSLLGFFVDDSVTVAVEDVALFEQLDLTTADFMIETSYQNTNSPQSYQTVPTQFW